MISLRHTHGGTMTKNTSKRPGGRPWKDMDIERLRDLASIQCTMSEIAAVMRCSVSALERGYADIIKEAREAGKESLRRAQWKKAVYDGHPTMLIWCGKFYLDQKEQISFTSNETDVRSLLDKWEVTAKKKTAYQIATDRQKNEEDGEKSS
jgi:hypothetical protein